jgi:hypothetical protein
MIKADDPGTRRGPGGIYPFDALLGAVAADVLTGAGSLTAIGDWRSTHFKGI